MSSVHPSSEAVKALLFFLGVSNDLKKKYLLLIWVLTGIKMGSYWITVNDWI